MRLDVSEYAYLSSTKIQVYDCIWRTKVRPNIHIQDLIDVYKHFILNPKIPSGFYNEI